MRLGKYALLILACILAFSVSIYAAPVGLTSEADATTSAQLLPENDMGLALSVGLVGDIVSEREISIDNGEFEMAAYTARLGLSIMKRFNVYADIGQATDMEYGYTIFGENHTITYDDELIWGVGINALIYRWDNGLEIGAHGSYRQVDLKLDSVKVDTVTYKRSQLTNISEDEFIEYQGALELAWKKDSFIPYVGVKYSDVDMGSEFTVPPTQQYDAKGKDANKNFGAFVGLTIIPKVSFLSKSGDSMPLSINLEARFIDEEAFNAGISYKF